MSSVLAWGAGSQTQAPNKERLFIPHMNDGGFQVRRSVTNLLLWVSQLEIAKFMPEDQDSNNLTIFEQKQER